MGEAIKMLEKAMLISLLYPCSSVVPPLQANIKKFPKLQVLDTGMLNYFSGLQNNLFGTKELDSFYKGRIAEHITGQEILSCESSPLFKLHFWAREKKQASAEIDFLIRFENLIIPVEVKSGSAGRLRSLHQFIDRAPHNIAVRVYSGMLGINHLKTIKGKPFSLLNLPFYLTGNIEKYIQWLISGMKNTQYHYGFLV